MRCWLFLSFLKMQSTTVQLQRSARISYDSTDATTVISVRRINDTIGKKGISSSERFTFGVGPRVSRCHWANFNVVFKKQRSTRNTKAAREAFTGCLNIKHHEILSLMDPMGIVPRNQIFNIGCYVLWTQYPAKDDMKRTFFVFTMIVYKVVLSGALAIEEVKPPDDLAKLLEDKKKPVKKRKRQETKKTTTEKHAKIEMQPPIINVVTPQTATSEADAGLWNFVQDPPTVGQVAAGMQVDNTDPLASYDSMMNVLMPH